MTRQGSNLSRELGCLQDKCRDNKDICAPCDTSDTYTIIIIMLVTLDVQNALNSAPMVDMHEVLQWNFRVPDYLLIVYNSFEMLHDVFLEDYVTIDRGQWLAHLT
ncbi:hypothetical protein J6590_044875 [Homalodisca vitripennis]|nr:hypothetical protein J6590_044875 [Homalodisca vitripennis]